MTELSPDKRYYESLTKRTQLLHVSRWNADTIVCTVYTSDMDIDHRSDGNQRDTLPSLVSIVQWTPELYRNAASKIIPNYGV